MYVCVICVRRIFKIFNTHAYAISNKHLHTHAYDISYTFNSPLIYRFNFQQSVNRNEVKKIPRAREREKENLGNRGKKKR